MTPSVQKSGAACGAEIVFDLARDFDDETFREIERAFHDNVVVVFRGQQLSNARHVEFSRRFGELEIHIVNKYLLPGFPQILLISSIRDERGDHTVFAHARLTCHTNTSYPRPPHPSPLPYPTAIPHL